MKNVVVLGGSTAVVSGVKVSARLSVIVPDGMTGKQLARWKAKNEKALLSMCESGEFSPVSSDGTDNDNDGGDSSVGG
jgi:hypothetical protein